MSFAKYIDGLETNGLQLTTIRSKLLQELYFSVRPFTAEDLVMRLDNHGVSAHRATVYRDLDYFVKKDLVSLLKISGEKANLYELKKDHRHHFKCTECGLIGDFAPPKVEEEMVKLQKSLRKRKGWYIRSHSLKLYGLCKKCNANETT